MHSSSVTPRKRLFLVLGLELYALLLALMQLSAGVRTDEAKYLLDIPYPHPPLVRFILHLNDGWALQEFFWRLVFATLLVQSVWVVLRLANDLKLASRLAIAVSWLLSTAILYQAGTIMMAPLTALEAGIFLFLLLRDEDTHDNAGVIALLWLMSLFTAYQAILFAPIVWALLLRSRSSFAGKVTVFFVPILLLALYSLSNPLVLASILIHTDTSSTTLSTRVLELVRVWFLGGSIVLSVIGFIGLLRSRSWSILLSFLLVTAYIFLARFDYYAILYLPLSIAGLLMLLRRRQIPAHLVTLGVIAGTIVLWIVSPPVLSSSIAGPTMQKIADAQSAGVVLIHGDFGHEWQYESRGHQILRYNFLLLPQASAIVCLSVCPDVDGLVGWTLLSQTPFAIYVRSH